jgi:hypothetical protein
MGMHFLRHDIGIIQEFGKNIFIATAQVNCLARIANNSKA